MFGSKKNPYTADVSVAVHGFIFLDCGCTGACTVSFYFISSIVRLVNENPALAW